jgi:hypothetical protein
VCVARFVAIGSATTSAALAAGGVTLMLLPSLVVGNELLIFSAVWRWQSARGSWRTATGACAVSWMPTRMAWDRLESKRWRKASTPD